MVQRIWYRDVDAGSFVEISDRVDKMSWQVQENAEEGSVAMSTITVEDPDMDITFNGHRRFLILEDESEATDNVIWSGFTSDQTVARQAGDTLYPLGRSWSLSLYDQNGIWQRRVMVGADCKRPAETDIERMTWLLGTNEFAMIDNATDWMATSGGVDMDACDYRGQMGSQVVDDCAQASGRNYFIADIEVGTGREQWAWYQRDGSTDYESPLYLTNDPTEWNDWALDDGSSVVWPISMDTELKRDPGRVYWGVYLPYERGAVYRTRAATAANFAKRDFVAPTKNVKSKTKAIARAVRYLDDVADQDERITTTVELPAGKATMIRAGMRVQFKASHLPGYEDWVWMRVLTCAIKPVAAATRYQLTLELQGPGVAADGPPPPVPTVKWISYSDSMPYDPDVTIEASDDGDTWSEVLTMAQIAAGTVDPPNMGAGTYTGIVELDPVDWSHRYWRITYSNEHPGGYFGGISISAFRLLSHGDWDAVCRLQTKSAGLSTWWSMALLPFAGDATWTGVCNKPLLYDYVTAGPATSGSGRQGQGPLQLNPNVEPPETITATWTFDLLGGA